MERACPILLVARLATKAVKSFPLKKLKEPQ